MNSIDDVLEEVETLIDMHFDNDFSDTKSPMFMKKVISNQSVIDTRLFKRIWRTLNCFPKTLKVIREIQENLLCVGKRREMITKKKADTMCWCSKTGLPLNAKYTDSLDPGMFKNMLSSWESSTNLRFTIYPLLCVPDFWEAVD